MRPAAETFLAFLRLGLTGFGGPVAHLAHFRRELVGRRRWLDESEFADTVALCQFLPGPTSSQVGFAIGMRRCGLGGGLAAWAGFTMPSAVAMAAAGWMLAGSTVVRDAGWLAGLRAFAAAVVAHAVLGMVRALAPTAGRAALAAVAAIALVAAARSGLPAWSAGAAQPLAIAACALAGALAFTRPGAAPGAVAADAADRRHAFGLPRGAPAAAGLALAAMLALSTVSTAPERVGALPAAAATCIRAGALVFGGGHVVLPLLEQPFAAAGWADRDAVVSGYALAQAVPGPLFTLAAYLGSAMSAPGGAAASAGGASLLLAAIFLPGLLLVIAALPAWHRLRASPALRGALTGANCAVIGVLAAALVTEVLPAAAGTAGGTALAAACFVALLAQGRVATRPGATTALASPLAVAAAAALAGQLALGT